MEQIKFCHLIDGSNHNPLLYNSIKFSDRERFEYTVISLEPENGLQEQMAEIGAKSFSLDYLSRRRSVFALTRLIKFFRSERTEIVQTHLFDSSLIGLTAARLARVPVRIFSGHHSHETPLYGRKLLTFLDGISCRVLAHHAIAPSLMMRDVFHNTFRVPMNKIEVVHHGFDLVDWREKAKVGEGFRKEFGLEKKRIFGAVGRLWWVKNFEVLVKAFASATTGLDDVVLVIAGGGEKAGLDALIKADGLQEKVFLLGIREDIASVISEFDVFVHSSLAESFGMVFIEAFALGVPIVSTPVGVAPEIIENGKNGFLAEGVNESALEVAIRKMIDASENWKEFGANAKVVSEAFDVRKTQRVCDDLSVKWLTHQ